MEVVPLTAGRASRAWDEQHLDLTAASRQIGSAPAGGFSVPVVSAAARFLDAWEPMVGKVGTQCEGQADGLRTAIRRYLDSDETSALLSWPLHSYLTEIR